MSKGWLTACLLAGSIPVLWLVDCRPFDWNTASLLAGDWFDYICWIISRFVFLAHSPSGDGEYRLYFYIRKDCVWKTLTFS